ncbi:hypothetical protein B0H14DRAFT_2393538, partial [Mycena olivaceomarginata]
EELIATIRATANEQTSFNVEGYMDEFSKSIASEVRVLLGEVGKLREERRALQLELSALLNLRAKYSPGGEFEPDWTPPPGAPGPPLEPLSPPSSIDLPRAKPDWRTVTQRATRKPDAAVPQLPHFDPRQVNSWADWQQPTPLVPDRTSPGLFGPRDSYFD